jgi:hypothetical protein
LSSPEDTCAFAIVIDGGGDNSSTDNESRLIPIIKIKNPYVGLFLLIKLSITAADNYIIFSQTLL